MTIPSSVVFLPGCSSLFFAVIDIATAFLSVYIIYSTYRSYARLSGLPGPPFAAFTRLSMVLALCSEECATWYLETNEKYGMFLRLRTMWTTPWLKRSRIVGPDRSQQPFDQRSGGLSTDPQCALRILPRGLVRLLPVKSSPSRLDY